jgi:hypothetical protein
MKLTPWVIHLAQTVCIRRVNSDMPLARIFGPRSRAEANARLIVAATNAAKEINPENPIAAAEAMPELMKAAKAILEAYDYKGAAITAGVKQEKAIAELRAAFLKATDRE